MHRYSHFSCQDLSGEKEQKQGLKVYKRKKYGKNAKSREDVCVPRISLLRDADFADFWYVCILMMGDYMYPDQYDYYPADTYYEDDCYNGSFDDNGWRTEESSQLENSVTWAQLWVFMYNNYHEQKDQAEALKKVQASLDRLEESWKCSPPSPEPEVSDFYTNDNVCELASPEYVMEGHTPWENQETIEMVENVVEEEVVSDNATFDSTAFDVFEGFENVELVMSEYVPSSDNLVDEDVVEGTVSDNIDSSPTIPEFVEIVDVFEEGGVDDNTTPEPMIFENFEKFESKDLVMGDFVPPSDQTSRSVLVPIHLLDDDQEVDADEFIFENNKKHDFITTHDPFMNGKLDVINTIDENIWKHPDMLPSDPIRLENFYWYCKPKLQPEDSMRDTSKRCMKQLLGAALGTLHVKLVILKRCRRKDRAWRFKATSKHSRELSRKQQPGSSRRTSKPFDPGKFEKQWGNEGTVVTEIQRRKQAYDPP
ncbi:hypothetical protein L2E82_18956 [Cichorium intybus]|uniref:Uncharacterized protein n=1 Tax=Cichorium intybus TaxID=13427 RepID=A0ACB9FBQ8_CICIN|nr:hypothetical protein L2E82_18956 [Cichorium intybus]